MLTDEFFGGDVEGDADALREGEPEFERRYGITKECLGGIGLFSLSLAPLRQRGDFGGGEVLTLDSAPGRVEDYLAKREFGRCLRRRTESGVGGHVSGVFGGVVGEG